jgi:hypothetical protein
MMETLIDLHKLDFYGGQAETVTWQGRQALRLEAGLALIPHNRMQDASLELLVGVEGPAYPGVAFRVADILNYELAYAVPHVSGQWDALQYDPVFHGSNTWQVYHGPGYQQEAQIPTGGWFRLNVDWCGQRAAVSVDGGSPLLVDPVAHPISAGGLGLWTYRPAYFTDLNISPCDGIETPIVETPKTAEGVVENWLVEDYGVAACEPNGVVNLNRYLPHSMRKIRLVRSFELLEETKVGFEFGFSDALTLELDGEALFEGENKFTGFADRASRGYAELGVGSIQVRLGSGRHHLAADLESSEEFGWGFTLAAHGNRLRWMPAEMG